MKKMMSLSDFITLDEETATQIADLFRTLSDSTRLKIISVIFASEQSVGVIAEAINLSESAVSHHLRSMRQLRIVSSRRAGKHIYYRLEDSHVADLFQKGLEHVKHD